MLALPLEASLVKDEVYATGSEAFSFKSVCRFLLNRESPLIEAKSVSKLDCMGEVIDVADFCARKFARDPEYARALVAKEESKVVCKKARRVIMSYRCQAGDGLCRDKDIGCYKLQERFASNLRVSHSSVLEEGAAKRLNCYFSSLKRGEVLKPRFQ